MESTINFHKYQGAGNDFIFIDNRTGSFQKNNKELIAFLCHRRFGIGADGVVLIENRNAYDFEMVYFNPDSSQSFCGNASRCAVDFAHKLGIIDREASFLAIDGGHTAFIKDNLIHVKMNDVAGIELIGEDMFVHTGSPHYIRFVEKVDDMDVFAEGRKIRYSDPYREEGTNVNFVQALGDDKIYVRTYERGVENETLSCGTGVTAAAIAASSRNLSSPVEVQTKGGMLKVSFRRTQNNLFEDVILTGPAVKVYEGVIRI